MIPLMISTGVLVLARLVGWAGVGPLDDWGAAAAAGLAAMFLFTGVSHFWGIKRVGMTMMVPPALTRRVKAERFVDVTGALELAGAVGLLVPATRSAAALCLAALLVVMFPANWHAQRTYPDSPLVSMSLPARTLVQVWFVVLCLVAAWA